MSRETGVRSGRACGFALVEMLLAIFLLAIGLASAAYMIPLSTRGLSQSKLVSQAAFFAQQRMEEGLTAAQPAPTQVDPDVPILSGDIHRVSWSQDMNLYYVTVVVYRTDDSSKRSIVTLESVGTGGPIIP